MFQMIITLVFAVFMLAVSTCQAQNEQPLNNYLDIETPSFFNFNSPLRQPDSLKKQPYFDFLSTLYRKDDSKANLFTNPPYLQNLKKREVTQLQSQYITSTKGPYISDHSLSTDNNRSKNNNTNRKKDAIKV
uniref:Uncharacterized protein n=1 Tax=Megaselia scalaris TaxID=36166 RepID=T1GV20_MEGSC